MRIMKLPGKHRNNDTKSNRKEREKSEKNISKIKSPKQQRIEDFLAKRQSCSFISWRDIQKEFDLSEDDCRKMLKDMEKKGYIKVRYYRDYQNKKNNSKSKPHLYDIVFKKVNPMIGTLLYEKFGGPTIKTAIEMKEPPVWMSKSMKSTWVPENIMRDLFESELEYLKTYGNYAESWGNLTDAKKAQFMKHNILKSKIICCHFMDVCKNMTFKERQSILSRICDDANTALYVLFNNVKLSKTERKKLVQSAAVSNHWRKLLETLKDDGERLLVLKAAFQTNDLITSINSFNKFLNETDKDYLALRIGQVGNAKMANEINDMVKFNDNQKDFFAHLVLAYKMTDGAFQ